MIGLLLITACTTTQPSPTEAPEDVVIEVGEVIFDGTECTVTGETKLPPGKYSYVLQDESEDDVNLFVGRLTEGMTFQDLLDLQDEPEGRVAFLDDLLDWAVEPGVEWQKPDGGEVHTYILTEEGEYAVGLWSWATENTPVKEWFCTPIWVKETPSD